MNIVQMAGEILEMAEELRYLRHENAELKKHADMLMQHIVDSNLASETQLHGWIGAILDGKLALTAGAQHE